MVMSMQTMFSQPMQSSRSFRGCHLQLPIPHQNHRMTRTLSWMHNLTGSSALAFTVSFHSFIVHFNSFTAPFNFFVAYFYPFVDCNSLTAYFNSFTASVYFFIAYLYLFAPYCPFYLLTAGFYLFCFTVALR